MITIDVIRTAGRIVNGVARLKRPTRTGPTPVPCEDTCHQYLPAGKGLVGVQLLALGSRVAASATLVVKKSPPAGARPGAAAIEIDSEASLAGSVQRKVGRELVTEAPAAGEDGAGVAPAVVTATAAPAAAAISAHTRISEESEAAPRLDDARTGEVGSGT